jgi:methylase of polypeptide subunit release factors
LAKPGGIVALELGACQAGSVAHMLASSGFTLLAIHPDLAGHERAITACLDPGHVALSTLSVGT